MKLKLLIICLMLFFLSSSYATFYFENKTIENPYFTRSSLKELIKQGIIPIYFQNGSILFYNISNKTFLSKIKYGNLTLVSNSSSKRYSIILSKDDLESWKRIYILRKYSNDYDLEILKEKSPIFYNYVKTRFKSLEDFLRYALKNQGLKNFDLESIEDFLNKNFEIDPIYDFNNIYEAILNKKIGYSHYEKVLETLLKDEKLIKTLSKLYKNPLFRQLIKNLPEDIKREIIKEYIRELLKSENLKELIEMARNVDKKYLLEATRDVLREVMSDPELRDELYNLPDEVNKHLIDFLKSREAQDFIKAFIDRAKTYIGEWGLQVIAIIFLIIAIYLIKA